MDQGPYGIKIHVEFSLKTKLTTVSYLDSVLAVAIGYVFNHANGNSEIELKRLEKDIQKFLEDTFMWIHEPKVTLSYKPPEAQAEDDET